MKATLVIGSTVVDVLLSVPRVPGRGGDVNISGSVWRIGGCAYNVASMLRHFDAPHLLCSPVGGGVFGRLVAERFARLGIAPFIKLEEENGCCYCLVEPDGERTFLSHHGAEYRFSRQWMDRVDLGEVDSVFVCGIEVEEPTGQEIVDFVSEHPHLTLYFAPGPRLMHIPAERMERLLASHPVLHLNKREALEFSGETDVPGAAAFLAGKTGAPLVITCGEEGAYCRERGGEGAFLPASPVLALDATGAGDAHCGAVIASLKQGRSLREAVETANRVSAAVVQVRGCELDRERFLAALGAAALAGIPGIGYNDSHENRFS